jgi:hypothetical protein
MQEESSLCLPRLAQGCGSPTKTENQAELASASLGEALRQCCLVRSIDGTAMSISGPARRAQMRVVDWCEATYRDQRTLLFEWDRR